jgi:hypothetical protein
MLKKRHKPEEIVAKLRQVDVLTSQGKSAKPFTPGATDDGVPVGYGFGWITNLFPYCNAAEREQLLALGGAGLRHVAHGGSCVAYNNYMIHLLDTQRTIIILTQSSGRSRSSYPGASGRGNALQRLRRDRPLSISRCCCRCSFALTR